MPVPAPVKTQQESASNTWIEIDLGRLTSNLKTLRNHVGPTSQVMAVVKANAYGHGLSEVAKALKSQVAYLGVASLYEAMELQEHAIDTPIFLFGRLFGKELQTAIQHGLTLSVSSLEEAEEISEISQSLQKRTFIHIKIDTGMGRMGIPERQAIHKVQMIAGLQGLVLDGIYTHFPAAEKADGLTEKQLEHFGYLIKLLEEKGIKFRMKHASNSAANLRLKNTPMNLIRPGLILYGIYPDASLSDRSGYLPVLSLKSRVIHIKRAMPGDTVGYGRSYEVKDHTNIGILPIGYSHGYPFQLSNKSFVLFQGQRYPLAGRVSMDYIAVDFGNAQPKAGDTATLIGEDGNEALSAEELAAWAGTIPYEIVTRLSSRLPRIYSR